jgi:hypothetical protein
VSAMPAGWNPEVVEVIPDDYEVRPVDAAAPGSRITTDGYCGLSWDDAVVTSMTPAPSGRCPFEPFHVYPGNEEADAGEVVIGWNDEEIKNPEPGQSLWDALVELEAKPETWRLDLEVRDAYGDIVTVVTLLERDLDEDAA